MKFKLEIEMGNDEMQRPIHVAVALKEVAANVHCHGVMRDGDKYPIMDGNGNKVGAWSFQKT